MFHLWRGTPVLLFWFILVEWLMSIHLFWKCGLLLFMITFFVVFYGINHFLNMCLSLLLFELQFLCKTAVKPIYYWKQLRGQPFEILRGMGGLLPVFTLDNYNSDWPYINLFIQMLIKQLQNIRLQCSYYGLVELISLWTFPLSDTWIDLFSLVD